MPPTQPARSSRVPLTERVDRAWHAQFERDAIGHRVHGWLAPIVAACLAGPTTLIEIAGGVILGYTVLRVANTADLWRAWLRQPTTIAWGLYLAWVALAILWSPDPGAGLSELSSHRWLLLGLCMFAVVDRRRRILAGFLVGVLVGQGAQALQLGAVVYGWESLDFDRPTRLGGWWGAVFSGVILTVALGLYMPGVLFGRGRRRWLSLAGATVTLVGLLATGTRTGWVAGGAIVLAALVVGTVRATAAARAHGARAAAPLLGAGVLATVIVLGAGAALGERVTERARDAMDEARAAWTDGSTEGSVSLRIAMAGWALDAFTDKPIAGVGSGGYRSWALEHDPRAAGYPDSAGKMHWPVQSHAHSTPLHVAASQGAVGLVLLMGAFALSCIATWRAARTAAIARGRSAWGTLDAGPVWAMGGIAVAALFDSPLLSTHGAAVVGLVLAMSPWALPSAAFRRSPGA